MSTSIPSMLHVLSSIFISFYNKGAADSFACLNAYFCV